MTLWALRIGRECVRSRWLVPSLVLWVAAGCESPKPRIAADSAAGEIADTVEPSSPRLATDATLLVSSGGSAALAMRMLSDSFATREAVQVFRETSPSSGGAPPNELERTPDILVREDTALSRLSRAAQVTWYVRFAADSLGGSPIVHGLSIPAKAANPRYAERFLGFVLSSDGQRILRAAHLAPLGRPVIVGTGAPPPVVALVTAAGGIESRDTIATAHPR